MHPKSVLLALHGLGLYLPDSGVDFWRIKRQRYDEELQLAYLYRGFPGVEWRIVQAGPVANYKEQSWDTIPDAVMDELPQKLIEKFLETK